MPPPKPVPALHSQAMLRLARSVAVALVTIITSANTPHASKGGIKKRKNKSGKSQPEKVTLIIPEKELSRIRVYLRNARPKQSKQNLFQQVLKDMTEMFTTPLVPKKHKKYDEIFMDRIKCLEIGLGYAFDIFLNSDIKCLDFINVQHLAMNWVDSCRLSNKDPKAESLMNHGQIERAMLRVLGQNASKISQVEELVWPHLVSGELLKMIAGHCASLQTLILSCECQVVGRDDDEDTFTRMGASSTWEEDFVKAIGSLYGRTPGDFSSSKGKGCLKLKRLVLPHIEDESGAAASSLANALEALRNLDHVSGLPMMAAIMKYKNNRSGLPALQLRNISDHDLYMRRNPPNTTYLKSLLPKLEMIDVIASQEITRTLAESFPRIKTLKVEWCDFEEYSKTFSYLVTVDLILNYKCVWQLLRNIGKHCRGIRSLTLRQPTLAVSADHENGVTPPKLPTLENLQLVRSSFIEFTAFKHLIVGCPNLKKLYITLTNDRNYVVDELDDTLIRNVAPYLSNLESFTVESLYRYNLCMHLNCTLTLDTCRELMTRCPNLTYIGHLDSWDVVDREVEQLQQEITQQNINLHIQ